MENITILGWYGHGNVGDESYKMSFPKLLPGYRLTFTDSIGEEHKKTSAAFVLGGGAVVEKPFLKQLNNIDNKFIMSVTANKDVPVDALRTFKQILVRDVRSQDALAKLGIPTTLMPDAAFLLSGNRESGFDYLRTLFRQEKHDLYHKVVVCVYNAHLGVVDDDRYLARDQMTFFKTANDLSDIVDSTPASFVFVPFGQRDPWDDRITNAWLASRCKFWKKNVVIYDRISFQQVLDIIACSDAVVSSRLHASIFSCVTGTPFVDITHHDKNLGFLQTVGLEDWSIPYWRFDYAKCKSLLNEFLTNPTPHRDRLQSLVEKQRHRIQEVMSHVHLVPQ
jgi:polysaccharide pyruvyl transferase WcaK-like protein